MILYKSIYLGIGIRSIEIRNQVMKIILIQQRALLNVKLSTEAYTYPQFTHSLTDTMTVTTVRIMLLTWQR